MEDTSLLPGGIWDLEYNKMSHKKLRKKIDTRSGIKNLLTRIYAGLQFPSLLKVVPRDLQKEGAKIRKVSSEINILSKAFQTVEKLKIIIQQSNALRFHQRITLRFMQSSPSVLCSWLLLNGIKPAKKKLVQIDQEYLLVNCWHSVTLTPWMWNISWFFSWNQIL